MSHFAVLVITDEDPTKNEDVLAKALQPFHEYECTGIEDEYVVDVDVTEKVRKEYADYLTDTEDDPPKDIVPWAKDWGGWRSRPDGTFYDHTNPNAQWDWWVVGGRYSGKLRSLSGDGFKGDPGLMGSETDAGGVDIVRRGDLDFDRMKARRESDRAKWIEEIIDQTGLTVSALEAAIFADQELHKVWADLPEPRPRGPQFFDWAVQHDPEKGALVRKLGNAQASAFSKPDLKPGQTIEQWIAAAPALSCWAVLKDGVWTEKGSMGWWGISTGDKDEDAWQAEVSKLIETLEPGKFITVVDCHI